MPHTPPSTGDILLKCIKIPSLLSDLCMLAPGTSATTLASILEPFFPGIEGTDPVVAALLEDLQNIGKRIWLQELLVWLKAHPAPSPWPHMEGTFGYGAWQPG